jgi:hypothetical protein
MAAPSELFPKEEMASKSPRLLWMEEHDVEIKFRPKLHPAYAYRSSIRGVQEFGYGATEEEACRMIGVMLRIQLWNERS